MLQLTLQCVVLLGIVSLNLWAYYRAWRLKLLRLGELIMAAAVAMTIPLVGWWLAPQLTLEKILAIGLLGPFSTLAWATTPLAVHWNRHR